MIAIIIAYAYENFETIAKIFATIAGLLGSIYAIKKLLITPIVKHLKKIDDFCQKVNYIYAEVNFNGGKSLKDSIGRIEKQFGLFNARLRTSFDLMSDPVYECNLKGECIYANTTLLELFNLNSDEFLGNGWVKGIVPEDRIRVADHWLDCVKKNVPYEISYRIKNHPDLLTTIALPLKDDCGVVCGYLGVFVNYKKKVV